MSKRLEVNAAWCKGCGICVEFCPKNVLTLTNGKVHIAGQDACLKCGICENLCPDFAIYLIEEAQNNG